MVERHALRGVASGLAALLAGLAHAWSVAAPWDGQPRWWLQLLALTALVWLLERSESWRAAAWRGWLFAWAWLGATVWWLFISMHVYGGLAAPLAVAAVAALAAALALYYALAAALYARLSPPQRLLRGLSFAALWLLAELARARWLTGFGWGGSGYAHVEGLLAGYAPWVGVHGLAFIAAWLAASLPQIWACGHLQRIAVLAVLALPSVHQMGNEGGFTAEAGQLQVRLLQGNIPQDEKFQPGSGVPTALRWYAEQLLDPGAQLVVAPETAVPLLPQQLPPGYWAALQARYAQGRQAALIGAPLGSRDEGYTNSAVGLAPGQPPWRYDKYHLVPFGEFIPPGFRWFTQMMNIPLGDFTRGPLGAPSFAWAGQRLAPNICYEDLFGEELATRFADPAQAPTVFVNLSNIAWFGNTVAIDQHLQISRMRALEFERPFVRATNTGATVHIDHRGQVQAELPRHRRGSLDTVVQGRQGLTPYARWAARAGLWPLWGLGVGIVLLALLGRSRRPQPAGAPACGP